MCYLDANCRLLQHFSQLMPSVHDRRQQTDAHHCLMPPTAGWREWWYSVFIVVWHIIISSTTRIFTSWVKCDGRNSFRSTATFLDMDALALSQRFQTLLNMAMRRDLLPLATDFYLLERCVEMLLNNHKHNRKQYHKQNSLVASTKLLWYLKHAFPDHVFHAVTVHHKSSFLDGTKYRTTYCGMSVPSEFCF